MNKLEKMYIKLQMDRSVDPDIHWISPGGYSINNKWFDFNTTQGGRTESDDTVVEYELFDYEEGDNGPVTLEDLSKGFDDFFVYTGENDEPPIFEKEVLEIVFRFRDDITGKETEVCADAKLLESANNIIRENIKDIKGEADYEDR